MDAVPESRQQLVMADQSARILDQISENIECLRREFETLVGAGTISPPDAQIGDVEPKR